VRWTLAKPRRVVLLIPNHSKLQTGLLREHFFLLSNTLAEEMDGAALLAHYRQRAGVEEDFGDWSHVLNLALPSPRQGPPSQPYPSRGLHRAQQLRRERDAPAAESARGQSASCDCDAAGAPQKATNESTALPPARS
jgi:hypothetical protein